MPRPGRGRSRVRREPCGLGRARLVQVGDGHPVTLGGEAEREGPAEAAGGSGDQDGARAGLGAR